MTAPPYPLDDCQMAAGEPSLLAEFALNAAAAPKFSFGRGWAPLEMTAEGAIRWSLDQFSEITIPAPWTSQVAPTGRILAELQAQPFVGADWEATQQLMISMNGRMVRRFTLSRLGLMAFWLPRESIGQPIKISFEHPDSRSPAELGLSQDRRRLGFAFRSLRLWLIPAAPAPVATSAPADQPAGEALARFESLGDNCEFGIVQRLTGIEPFDLLRFTAIPLVSLVHGLLRDFDGLGDPQNIKFDLLSERREYILTETRYNFAYHTFVYADEMPEERARQREAQKLALSRRRMLDGLRAARRIYVIKCNSGLADEDMISLFLLLRRFGPNRLLFVTPPFWGRGAGSVELILPGLARGSLGLAPYDDATKASVPYWVELCGRASALLDGA
jgi:hypothetical protein